MAPRPWLAPLGSILFGLLLLVAAEGLLRLVWKPPPLPADQLAAVRIDPFAVSGGKAQTRPAYFAAMRAATFAVPKPAGTYRIFCLGGSTTLGYPYPAEIAWPASLERRLAMLPGQRQVEVINVGATSYGSARTLAVLRGILDYQPDLVIVATGDAEFVEDSFRAAVASPAPAVTWLHGLYLSRAVKTVLPQPAAPMRLIDAEDRSAAGFLFAPAVAGTVYHVDPARRSRVMTALEQNLRTMTGVAAQARVPLMLVTLPANIASWPPDPADTLPADPALRRRWQQHVSAAEQLVAAGELPDGLAEYAAAARLWSDNATVCFEHGRLLLAAGQEDEARVMLMRAVELDPTPVRATAQINQTIREVAGQAGAWLADPAAVFAALAPHGLPGEELILDYAHPTPRGHVEIARVVHQALASRKPEWSTADAALEARIDRAEGNRAAAGAGVISADLSFVLGQVFERKGLIEQAAAMYRQALEQGYQGPFPTYNLARLYAMRGQPGEALALLTPVVARYPDWSEPYGLLGYLHQQRGETQAAATWYRRALDAGSRDPRLYVSLAELQLNAGQTLSARETLEEGLRNHQESCELAVLLGRTLERQEPGPGGAAEAFYRKRLLADPSCQILWENLGLLMVQQRRWPDAKEVFLAALRQPEPLAQHHLNLGYVYLEGLRDTAAANEQFTRFLQQQPDQVDLVPVEFRAAAESGGRP